MLITWLLFYLCFFQALAVLFTDIFLVVAVLVDRKRLGSSFLFIALWKWYSWCKTNSIKALTSVRKLLFSFRAQFLTAVGLRKVCFRVRDWWQTWGQDSSCLAEVPEKMHLVQASYPSSLCGCFREKVISKRHFFLAQDKCLSKTTNFQKVPISVLWQKKEAWQLD